MSKIIIYDSDHPGAIKNKCFETEYAKQGSGHGFTVELAKQAKVRNFEVVTSDVFLKNGDTKSVAFCITDMCSSKTNLLIRMGVIPMICLSTESPIIARNFYINFKKLAGRFKNNIQFRGTAKRLEETPTNFSVMYIPIDQRIPLPYSNWRDRKWLVLINRNKRIFYSESGTIKDIIRSRLSRVKVVFQKMADPWIRSKEIYKDRIESIYHFSKHAGFHLYGHGWENKIPGFSMRYRHAARKAFQGSIGVDKKIMVMNQYKFAICFENCVFPGYVTEKIFDCFLASCIPVYFGAPDIGDFVPTDTFIDYRKFRNFDELESYLENFCEEDAIKMLGSAKDFLASEGFDKYYTPNIVDKILNKIESYHPNPNN
jgi:hypothetical protein